MPYIELKTDKTLNSDQKHALQNKIGEIITLLPGKKAEQTMICIQDSCYMFQEGKTGPLCMVQLWAYLSAPLEGRKGFYDALTAYLSTALGIDIGNIYVVVREESHWGSGGHYR